MGILGLIATTTLLEGPMGVFNLEARRRLRGVSLPHKRSELHFGGDVVAHRSMTVGITNVLRRLVNCWITC